MWFIGVKVEQETSAPPPKKILDPALSLVVSASQDAGGYAISRQNNLELHLGCHTCWMSYFTLVCLWRGQTDGRAVGRCTVTWSPNFLRWVVYHIFLSMVLCCASFARESSSINGLLKRFFLGPTNHSCLLSQGIIGQLKSKFHFILKAFSKLVYLKGINAAVGKE